IVTSNKLSPRARHTSNLGPNTRYIIKPKCCRSVAGSASDFWVTEKTYREHDSTAGVILSHAADYVLLQPLGSSSSARPTQPLRFRNTRLANHSLEPLWFVERMNVLDLDNPIRFAIFLKTHPRLPETFHIIKIFKTFGSEELRHVFIRPVV